MAFVRCHETGANAVHFPSFSFIFSLLSPASLSAGFLFVGGTLRERKDRHIAQMTHSKETQGNESDDVVQTG